MQLRFLKRKTLLNNAFNIHITYVIWIYNEHAMREIFQMMHCEHAIALCAVLPLKIYLVAGV